MHHTLFPSFPLAYAAHLHQNTFRRTHEHSELVINSCAWLCATTAERGRGLDAPPASHADADVTAPLPLPHGTMSGAPKRGGVRGPFIAFYHFAPPYPLATPPSLLAVWSRHLNNPRPICLLCISVLLRALILGLSRTCFLSLSSG